MVKINKKIIFITSILLMTASINVFAAENYNVIPERAFENCTALSEFEIPDYVECINDYAFYNTALESVFLPENMNKLGNYAFAECPKLKEIYFNDKNTVIAENAFYNTENFTIYCYKNSTAYKFAVNNNIDYVFLDYDITCEKNDFNIEDGTVVSGSALIVDGSLENEGIVVKGDTKNNIVKVGHIDDNEIYEDYFELRSDETVSSGSIELNLSEGDELHIFSDILEDNTKIAVETIENSEFITYGKGNNVIRIRAYTDDIYKIYVDKGSINVYKIAVAKKDKIGHNPKPNIVYGDSDLNGIITVEDAARVYTKAINDSYITPMEIEYDTYEYLDVTGNGVVSVEDAAFIYTKAINDSIVFPVESE